MGKKKKKAQLGAWADDDAGEEFTLAPRGKAGRRQMSREQQRRGAATWADGSDGEDLPAQTPAPAAKPPQPDLRLPLSDLEGACNAHEQPSATGKVRQRQAIRRMRGSNKPSRDICLPVPPVMCPWR